jgi:hypothetical protein
MLYIFVLADQSQDFLFLEIQLLLKLVPFLYEIFALCILLL